MKAIYRVFDNRTAEKVLPDHQKTASESPRKHDVAGQDLEWMQLPTPGRGEGNFLIPGSQSGWV